MFLKRTQIRLARSIVALLAAGFIQVGISAPVANAAPLAAPTITSSTVTATSITVNLQTSGVVASSWRYIVNRRTVTGCSSPVTDGAVQSTGSLQTSITISGLTEGCYYTVKVAAFNGAVGAYAAVEKLVNGYVNGLKVYYKSENTTAAGFTRTPFTSGTCATGVLTSLNQNWGQGGPSGCGSNDYTAYVVGYIKAPYTGSVTFKSTNDDGLQLNIQGQRVFFNSVSASSPSGSINMVQDEIYRIEVWFHEIGGDSFFSIDWEYGSQTRTSIPAANIATDPSVFFGTCPIGVDSRCPAGSAYEIKRATNTNMDGHYWILIDGTPTLVFCIMNSSQGGGGWMLAMRGKNSSSEFKYDSPYWTNTTLTSNSTYPERFSASDTIDTYRNTDAKYAPFASSVGNQVMVLYPEVTDKGGGAFPSSNSSGVNSVAYGFAWYETFTSGKKWKAYNASAADGYPAGWGGDSWNVAHTNGPSSVPNCVDTPNTLTYLFTNASRCAFRQVQSNYNASESPYSAVGENVFFSQTDIRFFGINYGNSSTSFYTKSRIGFGWNENYGGNEASNDGNGGIGMASSASTSIAAGTYNGCCSSDNHLNPGQAGLSGGNGTTKQLGFELYVRNSTEISVAGRNYLKITQGRNASYTAGAGYYLSNNTGTTTFRLSAIRDGFTIDPSTGVVSASEALPVGTYSTTIAVGDANNASGTRTLTIQVVADSGNVDQSVMFNGTSQYLKTSGTIGLWGDFTYEAWIRPREDCTETNIYRRAISTSNFHISCGNGYWYVGITDNSSVFTRTKLAQRVVYEDWAHIAVVRSGTTVTVYYNNIQMKVLVGSSWVNSFTVSSIKNDYSQIYVGGTGTADEYFPGRVDEVKIWDTARSLTDIWTKSHEAENLGHANLLMYWDFNETTDPLASRSQRSDSNFNFTEYGSPFRSHIANSYSSGPYYYMTFPRTIITKNGGFQMFESVTALSVLVLGGGGGGGGGYQGGGGGAGGFKEATLKVDELDFYPIKVGVGGVGATNPLAPSSGETSTAFGVSAAGGGSGMAEFSVNTVNTQYPAASGASGGGGAHGTIRAGGIGISGQGFDGAYGVDLYPTCSELGGGGGGGATSVGAMAMCNDPNTGGTNHGGYGGSGLSSSIASSYSTYKGFGALAAGGGGSLRGATSSSQRGLGGSTSAGNSAYISGAAIAATGGATNGRANSGSGGGAGMSSDGATGYGGVGGSGVVIFRYIVASKPTFTKPTNAYLNVGMTETFTVNVAQDSETAQLTRTFRWESSTTGSSGTFTKIKEGTGAANAYFSWVPSDTSTSGSNFVYRVIVTDSDTAGLFIVDTSTAVFATINGALKLISKSSLSKTVNISKSETFTVSSGTPTYRYSLTPITSNFTLDTTTVGFPVIKFADTITAGTYYETFTVTDSVSASISVPLTITVNAQPSFSANSLQPLVGKYGTTVNETYTVIAGSETITATVTSNAVSGILWDTATARSIMVQLQPWLSAGTYQDTITATDIYGASTRIALSITIAKADTLTAYIDTPTALSYTGSAASFATNLIISGLKNSDTGTVSVSYKPGGLTCATGGSCLVGDIGPGGGIVFITPATANGNGKYFEAAPSNWTGSDDLASVGKFCEGSTNQDSINRGASQYGIGWGETNTALFESYCTGGAVKRVTSYAGGGYTDWFIPNSNELAELANVRNQAGLLELGANWATGNQGYWGSTEADASTMRTLVSVNSAWNIGSTLKSDSTHLMVRPVRMFSPCWAIDSCTAQASSTKPTDAGTYLITPSAFTFATGTLSNYETITYLSTPVTINKISQSALSLSTYSLFYPETMTIGTSGGNGSGRLLFTITGSSGPSCILDWRKLAASTPGTCTVEVNKAADRNYLATTTSAIIKFALFIPFVPLPTPEPGPSIGIQGTNSFIVDSNLAPAFTGLSASSGSIGSSITISGLGFSFADISKVAIKFWRGVVATTYSIPNDSTINVTVPTGATTGRIVITTPNGSVGTTTFTVTP